MKAKYYIGILSAFLLTGSVSQAQIAGGVEFNYVVSGTMGNNYYDDYDYYFSSRINRFHRSYTEFGYYAPVFTETYWYNYQPYSRGLSIYGGGAYGIGYTSYYPVYAYSYNNGWRNSYFVNSYYMGYDPFYYYGWYAPVVINVGMGHNWTGNYYGWNGRNPYYSRANYNNHSVYNTNNYYYSSPSSRYAPANNSSNRISTQNSRNNSVNNVSRRQTNSESTTRNADRTKSVNAVPDVSVRRSTEPTVNRGQVNNNNGNSTRSTTSSTVRGNSGNVKNSQSQVQTSTVRRSTTDQSGSASVSNRSVRTPSKSGTLATEEKNTSKEKTSTPASKTIRRP